MQPKSRCSCTAPANSRFWAFTTRTHKLGVRSTVRRGAQELVVSDDWTAPRTTRLAMAAPMAECGRIANGVEKPAVPRMLYCNLREECL